MKNTYRNYGASSYRSSYQKNSSNKKQNSEKNETLIVRVGVCSILVMIVFLITQINIPMFDDVHSRLEKSFKENISFEEVEEVAKNGVLTIKNYKEEITEKMDEFGNLQ